MPILYPDDLVGRTFLLDPQEDGQRFRARVFASIDNHNTKVQDNPELKRFKCSINNDEYEEILTYNQILRHIQKDQESDILWKFKEIVSHEGPLSQNHPHYNGSMYNVNIEWENGEITSEPLSIITADDPVTCAQYALSHDLLDLPGWKRFNHKEKRS